MEERYEMSILEAQLLQRGIISIYNKVTNELFNYVSRALLQALANDCPPLTIYINSQGGDLMSALLIHDAINSYPGLTTGVVIGEACSGANLILQACDARWSTSNSIHFVHDLMAMHPRRLLRFKKMREMQMKQEDDLMKRVYKIYRERTGLSQRDIRQIFDEEEIITAQQALKLHLIDKIVDQNDFWSELNK